MRERGLVVAHEIGDVFKKYPVPASVQASAPDSASRGPAVEWCSYSQYQPNREGDSRGWHEYRDQPSAPRRIAAPPMHPQAAGAYRAGTSLLQRRLTLSGSTPRSA
ncbi:hypothetical protein PF002_g1324 [Phytophthora fragariae]|uniref:Uncharacterized protein n=1 Tax=Phytophthora fragariae TaxID=53985 RepID=A0A6A4AH99_9STRA|nr:hypothetical protein PF003_g24726 [Phytophthora fragariae]KAE9029725.1 hypothetical protein PF011_g934 [Phytophthora fragariae]KAE9154857.1 hypothetical protein PF006_g1138 [Phytophthora fragariae]KAE9257108.1 hypothetical protein PF002_g1324 [Phytophthora fragariae]KAE9328981.1 hypothetical protein PF001_g1138 [Phytophthora fragariae]